MLLPNPNQVPATTNLRLRLMQEAACNTTPVTVMMLSPGSHSKHVSLSRSAKSVIFKESLKPCLINTQCLSFWMRFWLWCPMCGCWLIVGTLQLQKCLPFIKVDSIFGVHDCCPNRRHLKRSPWTLRRWDRIVFPSSLLVLGFISRWPTVLISNV